jgi:hypothetical protein
MPHVYEVLPFEAKYLLCVPPPLKLKELWIFPKGFIHVFSYDTLTSDVSTE